MNEALRAILRQREDYRALWYETYEPVRRVLSGLWHHDGDEHIQLFFDVHGGCEWTDFDTGCHTTGRYFVVGHGDWHYIALEMNDGEMRVFRVEDLDGWRLSLRWADASNSLFELTRRCRVVARAA